jgi:hypothetical protein
VHPDSSAVNPNAYVPTSTAALPPTLLAIAVAHVEEPVFLTLMEMGFVKSPLNARDCSRVVRGQIARVVIAWLMAVDMFALVHLICARRGVVLRCCLRRRMCQWQRMLRGGRWF